MNMPQPRFAAVVLSAVLWVAGAAQAGEITHFAAKVTDKVLSMEPVYGKPGPSRFAFRSINKGSAWISDDRAFDGTERTVQANWDSQGGVGIGSGFSTWVKGDASTSLQWNGVCSTVPNKDNKPSTSCAGGWAFIPGSGTGAFASLAGGGSWTGAVLPDGSFEGVIEGNYTR